jgi:hypothetical protein
MVLVGFATAPVFAAKERDSDTGTSHEHAYYTYMEEAGEVTVLVYSLPAHWRWEDDYFPLQVAVGARKGNKPLVLTLGDFQLLDPDGNDYLPASYDAITKEYPHLLADQQFLKRQPMTVGQMFNTYQRAGANFYPVSGGVMLRTSRIELPHFTWWMGTVYYPHPETGLDGILTLQVGDPSFDEPPLEVRFKVPPHKEHKDHKDKDHKKKDHDESGS